jgi:poly(A) polymerase
VSHLSPPVPVVPQLRVIAREAHGISRKNISPNALRVLYKLKEAGYAAYLVGGAVRDLLLGGRPKDFDVATDATPEQVRALFRNCRLIGRRFRLAHILFGDETIEVATFRAAGDDGTGDRHVVDGRIVRDNVYGSIEEDAVRRDFTANALYYAIDDFSVRDYVGGYDDVLNRRLRLIGDVESRYREDPVRMLRAVRLAAKLGFHIEDHAWEAIAGLGPLLAEAAPARLFDELLKLFMTGHALASFRWMEASGLLAVLMPSTAAAVDATGGKVPRLIEAALASTDERIADGRSVTPAFLLAVLMPSTAAAVDATGGKVPRLIEAALASTDERIADGRSVTPAFLLAALLWPEVTRLYQRELAAGHDPALAWTRAAAGAIRGQAQRMAMPKRFTIPMQEIWMLQPRFGHAGRKRQARLLAHPRFRAAYDFLLLRALDEPALGALVEQWMQLVQHDVAPAATATTESEPAAEGDADAPRARRRRRRKRVGGQPAAGG